MQKVQIGPNRKSYTGFREPEPDIMNPKPTNGTLNGNNQNPTMELDVDNQGHKEELGRRRAVAVSRPRFHELEQQWPRREQRSRWHLNFEQRQASEKSMV